MKTALQALLEQLRTTSLATKTVIGAAALLVVAVVAFTTSTAGRPHFQLLYSGLDAQHAAAVQAALAGGAIRYEVSQPPAPFVVHVDETQFYAAQNLVALSGALESSPEGIQTNGTGASQVFLSAPERAQGVLKREWQELEKQLEELDFVLRAHVSTSTPDPSPLRKTAPMTVAVTLQLRGNTTLEKAQASTVAKLVRYRFNVPQENVIIADQSGRSLFDGAASSELGSVAGELFEHKSRFDADVARTTNQILDRILGPGMAYVVVQSEWRCEESESVKETLDPKPVVVSKTESKSSTPQGAGSEVGGAAGTASNIASEFGTSNAAIGGVQTGGPGGKATTQETKTTSIVGRETEHKKSATPEIERLSIALFLDESLKDRLAGLEGSVKTAVGFVDQRDSFSSMVTPFASIPRDEQGKIVPPPAEEPVSEPNPLVETLIQRGVEIAAAIAFLFVLLKSLKGLPKKSEPKGGVAGVGDTAGGDAAYIEMLAKTEIQELVKSEPEKVSAILSRWAAEDRELAKAGR